MLYGCYIIFFILLKYLLMFNSKDSWKLLKKFFCIEDILKELWYVF